MKKAKKTTKKATRKLPRVSAVGKGPSLREAKLESAAAALAADDDKEDFPEDLIWLPAKDRPPFPGIIASTTFQKKAARQSAGEILDKRQAYFAFTYSKGNDDAKQAYAIGCMARVLRAARLNGDELEEVKVDGEDYGKRSGRAVRGNVQGFFFRCLRRIEIKRVVQQHPFRVVRVRYFTEDNVKSFTVREKTLNSYLLLIIAKVRELVRLDSVFADEFKLFISQHALTSPVLFLNLVSGHLTGPSPEELQALLSIRSLRVRMERTIYYLQREIEIFKLRKKIDDQVRKDVSKQQHQFFLREQLKHIKKELGLESDEKTIFLKEFAERRQTLQLSPAAASVVDNETRKLSLYDMRSPDYSLIRTYVEWILALPWGVEKQGVIDLKKIASTLARHHYGMQRVKERILEFMAVEKVRAAAGGSILCLVGPPGVGKTSLGRSIALATGRNFYHFSLGGMRDEAEIKGHRRTYVGALPGKFIQAIKAAGTLNAVIMLDEIDKLAATFRGDPAAALLEVLDREQNYKFLDHYLDIPFDLSKVLFIVTANQTETIARPLIDRMEVVELSGYVLEEKCRIAKRHLIPKLLREHGVAAGAFRLGDEVLQEIIVSYAPESGVRNLEKMLARIIRKALYRKLLSLEEKAGKRGGKLAIAGEQALKKYQHVLKTLCIEKKDLKEYLGHAVFRESFQYTGKTAGVVCGLAWTQEGGAPLYIEAIWVNVREKNETFRLTGNLGDVMMESAELAYSYVKALVGEYFGGKRLEAFIDKEIHIHVPAGATPKDGPSAGVAIATAILSLGVGYAIPANVAMTGELTLTGQILPVGGIREKVVAAKRVEKKVLYLPAANGEDFNDIPVSVRRGVRVKFVKEFKEIVGGLFPSKYIPRA